MATFSGYLMSILAFKIGQPCPWCFTSAGLSLSMCAIAWAKEAVPERTRAAVTGLATSLITGLACLTVFFVTQTTLDIQEAGASAPQMAGRTLEAPPTVTTVSSPQALRLAKKLASKRSKIYGAYWCSHCFHQKQLLGSEGYAKVEYVECAKRGVDSQEAACRARDVPGYPTWEIDGELYPGEKTLAELEEIVGMSPYKK